MADETAEGTGSGRRAIPEPSPVEFGDLGTEILSVMDGPDIATFNPPAIAFRTDLAQRLVNPEDKLTRELNNAIFSINVFVTRWANRWGYEVARGQTKTLGLECGMHASGNLMVCVWKLRILPDGAEEHSGPPLWTVVAAIRLFGDAEGELSGAVDVERFHYFGNARAGDAGSPEEEGKENREGLGS
jgi:hypothetical protein